MTQMWLLLSLIALKHTQVTTLNTHNSLRSITAAPNACANIMVDAPQSLQHGEMGRAMFSAGGRTIGGRSNVTQVEQTRGILSTLGGLIQVIRSLAKSSGGKRSVGDEFYEKDSADYMSLVCESCGTTGLPALSFARQGDNGPWHCRNCWDIYDVEFPPVTTDPLEDIDLSTLSWVELKSLLPKFIAELKAANVNISVESVDFSNPSHQGLPIINNKVEVPRIQLPPVREIKDKTLTAIEEQFVGKLSIPCTVERMEEFLKLIELKSAFKPMSSRANPLRYTCNTSNLWSALEQLVSPVLQKSVEQFQEYFLENIGEWSTLMGWKAIKTILTNMCHTETLTEQENSSTEYAQVQQAKDQSLGDYLKSFMIALDKYETSREALHLPKLSGTVDDFMNRMQTTVRAEFRQHYRMTWPNTVYRWSEVRIAVDSLRDKKVKDCLSTIDVINALDTKSAGGNPNGSKKKTAKQKRAAKAKKLKESINADTDKSAFQRKFLCWKCRSSEHAAHKCQHSGSIEIVKGTTNKFEVQNKKWNAPGAPKWGFIEDPDTAFWLKKEFLDSKFAIRKIQEAAGGGKKKKREYNNAIGDDDGSARNLKQRIQDLFGMIADVNESGPTCEECIEHVREQLSQRRESDGEKSPPTVPADENKESPDLDTAGTFSRRSLSPDAIPWLPSTSPRHNSDTPSNDGTNQIPVAETPSSDEVSSAENSEAENSDSDVCAEIAENLNNCKLDSEESKEHSNGDESVCSTDDELCDAFSNLMKKSESELRMSNLVSQMKRIRARNAQHRVNVERRRGLQLYFNGLRREMGSKTTSEAAPKTGGDNSPESSAPTESREAKRARIRQRAQELKRLNPQAIHSMGRCSDALWVEMYDGYVHLETKSSPQTTSPSSKSSEDASQAQSKAEVVTRNGNSAQVQNDTKFTIFFQGCLMQLTQNCSYCNEQSTVSQHSQEEEETKPGDGPSSSDDESGPDSSDDDGPPPLESESSDDEVKESESENTIAKRKAREIMRLLNAESGNDISALRREILLINQELADDNLIKNPGEAVIEETIAAFSFEIDPQNRQRLHFLAAASEGDDAVTGDFDIDDECEYDFINIFEFDARNVYSIGANEGHTRAITNALIMPVTMVELQPNGEYATSNVPLNRMRTNFLRVLAINVMGDTIDEATRRNNSSLQRLWYFLHWREGSNGLVIPRGDSFMQQLNNAAEAVARAFKDGVTDYRILLDAALRNNDPTTPPTPNSSAEEASSATESLMTMSDGEAAETSAPFTQLDPPNAFTQLVMQGVGINAVAEMFGGLVVDTEEPEFKAGIFEIDDNEAEVGEPTPVQLENTAALSDVKFTQGSTGTSGSCHRSIRVGFKLNVNSDNPTQQFLHVTETMDCGASRDYIILSLAKEVMTSCSDNIIDKGMYKESSTTSACGGKMVKVGFFTMKVRVKTHHGTFVMIDRRYEVLAQCVLILIQGVATMAKTEAYLDIHNQITSATMRPEYLVMRFPKKLVIELLRTVNNAEITATIRDDPSGIIESTTWNQEVAEINYMMSLSDSGESDVPIEITNDSLVQTTPKKRKRTVQWSANIVDEGLSESTMIVAGSNDQLKVSSKYKIELPIAEQAQLTSCIKPDPKNGNWSPLSGDERTPKKILTLRSDNSQLEVARGVIQRSDNNHLGVDWSRQHIRFSDTSPTASVAVETINGMTPQKYGDELLHAIKESVIDNELHMFIDDPSSGLPTPTKLSSIFTIRDSETFAQVGDREVKVEKEALISINDTRSLTPLTGWMCDSELLALSKTGGESDTEAERDSEPREEEKESTYTEARMEEALTSAKATKMFPTYIE